MTSEARILTLLLMLGAPLLAFASGHDDCVLDASKRPTELGVKMARQACDAKFSSDIDSKRAAANEAAESEAEAKAAMWRLVGTKYTTVTQVTGFMGRPLLVTGPQVCVTKKGRHAPSAKCLTYHWMDERAGRTRRSFMVEVENTDDELVWAWSRDSLE